MRAEPVVHRHLAAMGTIGTITVVDGDPALLDGAVARIDELEARWSRFRPDSEISRLNRAGGDAVAVSTDTFTLVELAVDAWRATAGWFDPTVLPALLSLGYTRSFELLGLHGLVQRTTVDQAGRLGACASIELDPDERTVRLPAGTMLDPGGIGKGLACDLVARQLRTGGAAGALVDLGGDLRVLGTGPDDGRWTITIDDAFVDPYGEHRADEVARVRLRDGAVATSSTIHRRWEHDGEPVHHLVDPRSGHPSDSGLVAATVVAADAATADAVAKAALLAGPEEGPAIIDALDTAGLLVTASGDVIVTPDLRRFT